MPRLFWGEGVKELFGESVVKCWQINYYPFVNSAAQNILFNVLGGLLTVPAAAGLALTWKKWRNRNFAKVFGPGKKCPQLAYGSLTPNLDAVEKFVAPDHRAEYRRSLFIKPLSPGIAFSTDEVSGGCEVRALTYVSSALIGDANIKSTVVSDEFIKEKVDLDFISFGFANNVKTLDLFANCKNEFADFDYKRYAFVSKKSGRPIYHRPAGGDYGLILRIHPDQFPERTWLCCAGLAEWGTSGSAWFLARKWRQLSHRLDADEQFLALIAVKSGQDESATLIGIFKTADQLEEYLDMFIP
jgi:hypothetical protein